MKYKNTPTCINTPKSSGTPRGVPRKGEFSLHYLEDLSYQEIADTFNQSTGTVRVSVHRALGLLRKTIEAQRQNDAQLDLAALLKAASSGKISVKQIDLPSVR